MSPPASHAWMLTIEIKKLIKKLCKMDLHPYFRTESKQSLRVVGQLFLLASETKGLNDSTDMLINNFKKCFYDNTNPIKMPKNEFRTNKNTLELTVLVPI